MIYKTFRNLLRLKIMREFEVMKCVCATSLRSRHFVADKRSVCCLSEIFSAQLQKCQTLIQILNLEKGRLQTNL